MNISVTVREICDKGKWMDLCDITGINEWALSEGRIDYDERITLTDEQACKLGLIQAQPQANKACSGREARRRYPKLKSVRASRH